MATAKADDGEGGASEAHGTLRSAPAAGLALQGWRPRPDSNRRRPP